MGIRLSRLQFTGRRTRAFTLLEVALIVAIVGMMLMIVIGYLFTPKPTGPLPPVAETTPIPPSGTPPSFLPSPAPAPTPTPAPATPTPVSTPEPAATPRVIQVNPGGPLIPSFR